MLYILGIDNILVDGFEVFDKDYFEAKPLPGIKDFLRNELCRGHEIVILCNDLKQKYFINKNFTFIDDNNIIIDNRIGNRIEIVEDFLGRSLDENDKLIDSPPHLLKRNNYNVIVAISDNYLFDEEVNNYDLRRYIKIYEDMKYN